MHVLTAALAWTLFGAATVATPTPTTPDAPNEVRQISFPSCAINTSPGSCLIRQGDTTGKLWCEGTYACEVGDHVFDMGGDNSNAMRAACENKVPGDSCHAMWQCCKPGI